MAGLEAVQYAELEWPTGSVITLWSTLSATSHLPKPRSLWRRPTTANASGCIITDL